jgi:hypothetical protein
MRLVLSFYLFHCCFVFRKVKTNITFIFGGSTGLRIKCDANAECLDVSFSWPSVFLARCVIPVYLWSFHLVGNLGL